MKEIGMVKGWWVTGADTAKQVVVDTLGVVYNVTGMNSDGSLELEAVYDGSGRPLEPGIGYEPDIESDFDPAQDEPNESALGYGYLS